MTDRDLRQPSEREIREYAGNGSHGSGKNGSMNSSSVDTPRLPYVADIYTGSDYKKREEELTTQLRRLIDIAQVWSPDVAERMVEGALKTCNPDNASMICIRKAEDPPKIEKYKGIAWQELEHIPTPIGVHNTVWMKFRILDPDIQGLQLGRWVMQQGIVLYLREGVDSISAKTGSRRAVHAFFESGVFPNGCRYSRDRSYLENAQMPFVVLWLHARHHINGPVPDLTTGISLNDYEEPNGADPVERYKNYPNIRPTLEWLESIKFKPQHTLYEVITRER